MQIGSVEIKLTRTLNLDGEDRTTLTMREPLVEDQMVAAESSTNNVIQEITLMANLCGLSPDGIKKMPMRDYDLLREAYKGFTD